jgi:hypothetical protein
MRWDGVPDPMSKCFNFERIVLQPAKQAVSLKPGAQAPGD